MIGKQFGKVGLKSEVQRKERRWNEGQEGDKQHEKGPASLYLGERNEVFGRGLITHFQSRSLREAPRLADCR